MVEYTSKVTWKDSINACMGVDDYGHKRYVAQWRSETETENSNVLYIYDIWGAVKRRCTGIIGEDVRVSHNHFSQTLYP